MRVWAWTLWIQSEGTSVQRPGKGRGTPLFANPSLWTELEPGLAKLLGLAFLDLAGGRPLSNCGSFWVSWPTRNPSHSSSTRWAPTGGDCEKVKHNDITQGLGCTCVLPLQSCPTLCDPVGASVHGTCQARILEWVAMSFSRGSSLPRDPTAANVFHTGNPHPAEAQPPTVV